jgi:glycosyltransferase involved in cell wall biosynthesis
MNIDLKETTSLINSDKQFPKITAIIPAKNEEKNLPFVLPKIPSIVNELILIDGLSSDRTNELARELRPDIKILKQTGRGKGNALRCGFQKASGDLVVMLDADGSMDPAEIPGLIEPLLKGFDVVKGSRFLPGGGTSDMERHRRLGNKIFLTMVNLLFKSKYSDLCYGYMAFKKEALQKINIVSDGFEIETEINVKVLKAGLKVTEVPSFEKKRLNGNGSLRCWQDGRRIISTIFKLRFGRSPI